MTLTGVGRKRIRKVAKSVVDARCHATHAGSSCERDQRNDQRIFNQVLAFFLGKKVLHSDIYIPQCCFHFYYSSSYLEFGLYLRKGEVGQGLRIAFLSLPHRGGLNLLALPTFIWEN
jgi:hypothetical protein